MIPRFRHLMAIGFSVIFFSLAVALGAIAAYTFVDSFLSDKGFTEGLLKALNMAVISLATFELGLGVNKEYAGHPPEGDILILLRRTVSQFVSIVCIALVLEGLIMVIKYSQLDLAGNLYYPVAIIASAAALLVALGAFIRLTSDAAQEQVVDETSAHPALDLPPSGRDERAEELLAYGRVGDQATVRVVETPSLARTPARDAGDAIGHVMEAGVIRCLAIFV